MLRWQRFGAETSETREGAVMDLRSLGLEVISQLFQLVVWACGWSRESEVAAIKYFMDQPHKMCGTCLFPNPHGAAGRTSMSA